MTFLVFHRGRPLGTAWLTLETAVPLTFAWNARFVSRVKLERLGTIGDGLGTFGNGLGTALGTAVPFEILWDARFGAWEARSTPGTGVPGPVP